MSYLIDSDWLIDLLKGRQHAFELIQRLGPRGIAMSLISYGEVYEGIVYGTRPELHRSAFERIVKHFP